MDNIADALIRIKNGYQAGKPQVQVRFSKLILRLCEVLVKEGYVKSCKQNGLQILVTLKYTGKTPALTNVKRVSKPGLRIYKGTRELHKVLDGLGIAIVSTPKGLMTEKEARKQKVGGEVMAEVW